MEIELIKPYGFCVGVKYVIDQLNDIISKHSNESVFCVGQLVHNQNVVNSLKDKGVTILDEDKEKAIDKISSGVVVFSAHGTDENIIKKAKDKGLIVYEGHKGITITEEGQKEARKVIVKHNTLSAFFENSVKSGALSHSMASSAFRWLGSCSTRNLLVTSSALAFRK